MKLLFLDIDGVLNGHELQDSGCCGAKEEAVHRLNQILWRVPSLQLVICSAWRYLILQDAMTIKGFENMLRILGVDCGQRVLGHTKSDEEIRTRGAQILEFLQRYSQTVGGIEYCIVDDDTYDYKELGLTHVKTVGSWGLTGEDVDKIVTHFK